MYWEDENAFVRFSGSAKSKIRRRQKCSKYFALLSGFSKKVVGPAFLSFPSA